MMTNEQYLEGWYEKYDKDLLYYLLSIVKDYHQAEDLMHETFLKAYLKIHTLMKEAKVKPWLFSIAHNIAIDYLRKQNKLDLYNQKLKNNILQHSHPDVLKETSIDFLLSLHKIKASYRQIIVLRKIIGYSTNEVGERLNWSDSKVKTTLARAKCSLKKQLIEDEQ